MAIIKPVILRSPFHKGMYLVYVPVDNLGTYWSKWVLSWKDISSTTGYPIHDVLYGKCVTGTFQKYSDGTAVVPLTALESNGIQYGKKTSAGNTVHFHIPNGHNRIHVLVQRGSSWGTMLVALTGGGLLVETITLNTPAEVSTEEIVLTTNSTTADRILTFTAGSSNAISLIGIRTFNDAVVGSPAVVGNDLVDKLTYDAAGVPVILGVTNFSTLLCVPNTVEFTIQWRPNGETGSRWTAYGLNHSANAAFIVTSEATLFVDGVSQGTMYDINNIALGECLEADRITMFVTGYGDWNANAVNDDALQVRIMTEITRSGVAITNHVTWSANGIVNNNAGPYIPSLPIAASIHGRIRLLPDKTEYDIDVDYSIIGNRIEVQPDGLNCRIIASTSGPVLNIFDKVGDTEHKMYLGIDPSMLLGVTASGSDWAVASGSVWVLSGFISIQELLNKRRQRVTNV